MRGHSYSLPSPRYGELEQLPEELRNEPYTDTDNGLRMKITRVRKPFRFEIVGRVASCTVGDKELSFTSSFPANYVPSKSTSNISVLNVYDTYGIKGAYSFLKYLLQYKQDALNPHWLVVYLEGSLLAAQPLSLSNLMATRNENFDSGTYPMQLALRLLDVLYALEAKKPRASEELRPLPNAPQLPIEILARLTPYIIASKQVSREVRSQAALSKCSDAPTEDELWNVKRGDMTGRTLRRTTDGACFCQVGNTEWLLDSKLLLTVDRTRFRPRRLPEGLVIIAEYPLTDYWHVYHRSNCDANASMLQLLRETSERLQSDHDAETKAWLVQLTSELEPEAEGTQFADMDAIRSEVHRLLQLAMSMYE